MDAQAAQDSGSVLSGKESVGGMPGRGSGGFEVGPE